MKKRTVPNKEQASELIRYFQGFFRDWSRYRAILTDEQQLNARSELRQINLFSDNITEEVFAWAQKHIPPKAYSNAMRAVNRKIKGSSRSKSKHLALKTVAISQDVKLELEMIKSMHEGLSYNDVLKLLIETYRASRKL
ncbi:hypothetical protein [Aliidiomarina quisquiliarum]|uniref:hypothetical protein n=1 Tax=Aliidiomarina quisquiliarum TaxID=2938947 RepID=UPI00208F7FE6|nr:hypothetical protein [Aliidiomarina quisquiliarum]MCO4320346.1 hypothetical protein [Aliidiomarina quisquiliarum]